MRFVAILQAAQDGDGVLDAWFANKYGLKSARECGVLLNVFAIFRQSGGANTAQFTAGKRWFKQVASAGGALGLTRAHNGVQLIHE